MDNDEEFTFKLPTYQKSKPSTSTPWRGSASLADSVDSGYRSFDTENSSFTSTQNISSSSEYQLTPCTKRNLNFVYSGCEIGEEFLDFLEEFNGKWRQCTPIVSMILSYLTDSELCAVCCVSKKWRDICTHDVTANKRRLSYLNKLKSKNKSQNRSNKNGKENCTQAKDNNFVPLLLPNQSIRLPGNDILNIIGNKNSSRVSTFSTVGTSNNSNTKVKSRHEMFVEEALKLKNKNESLLSCPKCASPAVLDPIIKRAKCNRESCQHSFCGLCLCDDCQQAECKWKYKKNSDKNKVAVGSKRSKLNLRRL